MAARKLASHPHEQNVVEKGLLKVASSAQKSKDVLQLALNAKVAWEEAKQAAQTGQFRSSQLEAISKDMKSADSTKKMLNMDVVRPKGQDRLAEKRRKSHVCFGDGVEEAEAVDAEAGAANGGEIPIAEVAALGVPVPIAEVTANAEADAVAIDVVAPNVMAPLNPVRG